MAVFTCEKCGCNLERAANQEMPSCGETGCMCKRRPRASKRRRNYLMVAEGSNLCCSDGRTGLVAQAAVCAKSQVVYRRTTTNQAM